MKKYKVFCSFGAIDKGIKKHELVAVENGKDIYEATDRLIKAVRDDALGMEKYQRGYTAAVYPPTEVEYFREVKRYEYYIRAILQPDHGPKNDVIEYGIVEEDE